MLTLAKEILTAMCDSTVPKVLGSVECKLAESIRTVEARDEFAKRLQKQNKMLTTVLQQLNGALANATAQQLRLQHLEDQLQQTTDRCEHVLTEAAEVRQAHAVEIERLAARLKRKNKTFSALEGELNALIEERRAEEDCDANEDESSGDDGVAASRAQLAGAGAAAAAAAANGERAAVWHMGDSLAQGEDEDGEEKRWSANDRADEVCNTGAGAEPQRGPGGPLQENLEPKPEPEPEPEPELELEPELPFKDIGANTDDVWMDQQAALETAEKQVVQLQQAVAEVTANGRRAEVCLCN